MAEKYCTWDDISTGINPFAPVRHRPGCLRTLVGVPLFLIRAPIVLLTSAALLVFHSVFALIPISPLRRPLVRFVDIFFSRLILLLLGFFSLQTTYANLRKLRLVHARTKKSSVSFASDVSAGDYIFSNYNSFVQILMLTYWFSPTFTVVSTGRVDKGKVTKVVRVTLASALLSALSVPKRPQASSSSSARKKEETLADVAESVGYWSGPIVVFPEAVRTNGKGILKFQPLLLPSQRSQSRKIHLIGFTFDKASGKSFSPSQPVMPFLAQLWKFCSQISHNVSAVSLSSHYFEKAEGDERFFMAQMLRLKPVDLNSMDYHDFVRKYRTVQSRKKGCC